MTSPAKSKTGSHILVLGAYGLIGACVARHLDQAGCRVTGFGRSQRSAHAVLPDLKWHIADLRNFNHKADWSDLLDDVDFVVNCAGALQENYRDELVLVHEKAIAALAGACADARIGFIQISAVGVSETATTQFLKTKARGDAAVRNAGMDYWIFRPGLVLAPNAYGGTALLRMIAAVPLVQPLAFASAKIQTVSVEDVSSAVLAAIEGNLPPGTELDLVEKGVHELRDVIALHRRWLGFPAAKTEFEMPDWLLAVTSRLADLLGLLGWRSPLRSTAVKTLKEGVLGCPEQSDGSVSPDIASLETTLAKIPASAEDRFFARSMLLMPFIFATLFAFWFLSGVIGLLRLDEAAGVLIDAGWSPFWSKPVVVFWAIVDILIALAVLIRKTAAAACWAMIAVSAIYLLSATFLTPDLWLDPLGPLIKAVPGILLALVARIQLENR